MKETMCKCFVTLFVVLAVKHGNGQALAPGFYNLHNDTFNYNLLVPVNSHPQQKYPLIMYLHGYQSQVDLPWFNDAVQQQEPCFMFVPLCNDAWGGSSWGGTYDLGWNSYPNDLRPAMASALNSIDSLKNRYPIDTNRIIVYGGSMGAEGVFMLMVKKPTLFAAAVAVAGYTLTVQADQMAQTPLWILHGGSDVYWDGDTPWYLTVSSRNIYAAILAAGGMRVRYTEYPGLDHVSVWGRVEEQADIVPFMLAQNKSKSVLHTAPQAVTNFKCRMVYTVPTLFWDPPSDTSAPDKKIWYYRIYRNDQLVVTQDKDTLSQIDTTAQHDSGYTYKMTAVNLTFNESAMSNSAALTSRINPSVRKKNETLYFDNVSVKSNGSGINVSLNVNKAGMYSIAICNSGGKTVCGEKSRYCHIGFQTVSWSAPGAASGLYIAEIKTPLVKKMIRFVFKK